MHFYWQGGLQRLPSQSLDDLESTLPRDHLQNFAAANRVTSVDQPSLTTIKNFIVRQEQRPSSGELPEAAKVERGEFIRIYPERPSPNMQNIPQPPLTVHENVLPSQRHRAVHHNSLRPLPGSTVCKPLKKLHRLITVPVEAGAIGKSYIPAFFNHPSTEANFYNARSLGDTVPRLALTFIVLALSFSLINNLCFIPCSLDTVTAEQATLSGVVRMETPHNRHLLLKTKGQSVVESIMFSAPSRPDSSGLETNMNLVQRHDACNSKSHDNVFKRILILNNLKDLLGNVIM
jgi:hypothetical protein